MTTTHRTAAALAAVLTLGACSATTGADGQQEDVLRVVTHDSFHLSDGLLADFEEATGYTVELIAPGDGGALVNQLVLTRDNPLGDVVFGIDNSFAARAVEEGVLAPYRSPDAAETAFDDALTAVDYGDVCVNIDRAWFAEEGLAEPRTLADLADPAYADLLVVTNPATSSPGLAFLLATVAEFGEDGWEDYWRDLTANGVRVVEGWSDAYYVDFSGSEGAGPRPLALSYSSSPAAEVPGDGSAPGTGALLETCFRQTEYAGVLSGARNVEGAQAFVDFLLSPQVQADIPGSMYMYPVQEGVELPAEWAEHAPASEEPLDLAPEDITENRDRWVETWTEIVVG
ncbi:thiamine ABC transporter substrate-binding protein [Georgenia wutianyii]|uniref:Thiamine ABC transporter substrate-binding protein n=1 Tax=Georgenia wutianyii TaxID=2585135 RepID=A0ABX5VPS2_9MICO|nr:thiamine ABC transporter substrate-binding protein [Georgenia wutianyii]QDB80491.1 thiamine ABC transporter substrate-binding protein [Georgenia wutianyii]